MRTKKEKQEKEKKPRAPRKVIPVEEKVKRGRLITLFLLILSVLISYLFSLQ